MIRANKKKLAISVFFVVLFLLGSRFNWWNGLQQSFHFLTYRPRQNLFNWLNQDQSNKDAKQAGIAACQARLLQLEEENQRARKLLGTDVKPDTQFHLLKIISFKPGTVLLSNQKNVDLDIGNFVVKDSFLIGKISKVQGKVNQARLLSFPEISLPVKIWSKNPISNQNFQVKSQGILTGRGPGPGELLVEDVLFKDEVEKEDWVGAISSTGDIFLIGKVKAIQTSKDKVFETLTVNWAVEPKKLLTVGVVGD